MSIRGRTLLGAVLLFVGLLVATGGSIKHSTGVVWFGFAMAAPGPLLIFLAFRDMMAEIGDAGRRAEEAMRREISGKNSPPPKPPT